MTNCKWLSDEFDAICCNSDCPAEADLCPALNYPEICKFAEAERKTFTPPSMQITETNIAYYDKVETHENCTVQILTNRQTGEVSVGWWENTNQVKGE